jgi:hypothetical protein
VYGDGGVDKPEDPTLTGALIEPFSFFRLLLEAEADVVNEEKRES